MTTIDPEGQAHLDAYLGLLHELWRRTSDAALAAAHGPGRTDGPSGRGSGHSDPTAAGRLNADDEYRVWRAACRAEARYIQRRWERLMALLYPEQAPNLISEIDRGIRAPDGRLRQPHLSETA